MSVKNILLWVLGVAVIGFLGFLTASKIFKPKTFSPETPRVIKETSFTLSGKVSAVSENAITIQSDRGSDSISFGESVSLLGEDGFPADRSYLVPGVSVVASGHDNLAEEIKVTDLPDIIILSPSAGSPVGLGFDLSGFYKASSGEVSARLTNNRTNIVYFEKSFSPEDPNLFYEKFSDEINLKTAFDVLDKDSLTLSVSSSSLEEKRLISFGAGLTAKIKVPFLSGAGCASLSEAERLISASRSSVRSVMEELISGPVESEAAKGMRSAFPPETKIRLLRFENTAILVDFSKELLPASQSSCLSAGLKAQLASALSQFPTVVSYEFRIDGRDWYKSQ